MTPEQIQEMERKRIQQAMAGRQKIAESKATATPVTTQRAPLAAGQMGGQQSPLQQFGMQIGKKLLGGLFGGLFNEGGMIQGYNKGGQTKSWWDYIWGTGPKKGSIADQINWGGKQKKNVGGMINMPLNPNGYNEGGMAQETPLKKVMDEQKLEQQAVAFDLEQKRKQEAHDLAMKQKQQQFSEAQKMKKEAATTNKKPKTPLSK